MLFYAAFAGTFLRRKKSQCSYDRPYSYYKFQTADDI